MNYTMFVGGLSMGTSEADKGGKLQNISKDDLVIIFDVIDSYNISLNNEKTQYAIESRSSVTDHVFSPDGKFNFSGRVTSAPYNIRKENEWDKNTDVENPKSSERIKKAYDVLVAARNAKQKITLDFEEGVLDGYVITSLEMTRDSALDQLSVNISLEEMRTVTVGKTVLALNVGDPLKTDASGNKNKGAVSKDGPDGKGKNQPCTTSNLNFRTRAKFEEKVAKGDKRYEVCGETRYVFTREE